MAGWNLITQVKVTDESGCTVVYDHRLGGRVGATDRDKTSDILSLNVMRPALKPAENDD